MSGQFDPDDAILIALGSNLPGQFAKPEDNLSACLQALNAKKIDIIAVSRMWRSGAWPNPDEPDYINAVAIVECDISVHALLCMLQDVEKQFGRIRKGLNAPRTVDLDLIAFGRLCLSEAKLTLPHPRAHERAFVMGPLCDVLPGWRHPVLNRSAADLFEAVTVGRDARPLT